MADRAIEPFRRELLLFAFEAASRFPSDPHGKSRGRAQDLVVAACFTLEQPRLALGFAPRVEGWRRGAAYADYAWYAARHGDAADARRLVRLAQQVVDEQAADPDAQQWRADSVRVKLARALGALGDADAARRALEAVDASSAGAVDATWADAVASRAGDLSREAAEAELLRVDRDLATMSLGDQYAAIVLLTRLHGRFYGDEPLRVRLAERVGTAFVKLPGKLQLDGLARLADDHLAHGASDDARTVVTSMAELVEAASWRPEERLPELARLAELRHRCGDGDLARAGLEAALAEYHRGRDEVFDVYRCETLRPIAIAWQAVGEAARAQELIALAVEEGAENPNARPRCDDLVETCVELALRGVEPTPALWQRLREIREGLVDPW